MEKSTKINIGDAVVCISPIDGLGLNQTYIVESFNLDHTLVGCYGVSGMFFLWRFKKYTKGKKEHSASWWLDEAAKIQDDRAKEYDKDEERSAAAVANIFNTLRKKDLTEADVFLMLQILKLVRFCSNPEEPHMDSLLDNVSYAALFAEAATSSKDGSSH